MSPFTVDLGVSAKVEADLNASGYLTLTLTTPYETKVFHLSPSETVDLAKALEASKVAQS